MATPLWALQAAEERRKAHLANQTLTNPQRDLPKVNAVAEGLFRRTIL